MTELFNTFAKKASDALGSSWAFVITVAIIVGWLIGGLFFGFGDFYQILINTVSTLATSIFIVVVQHTQNRDATAIHLKLDELLRATKGARNSLVDLEDMTESELEQLRAEFHALHQRSAGLLADDVREVEDELHRRKRARHKGKGARP